MDPTLLSAIVMVEVEVDDLDYARYWLRSPRACAEVIIRARLVVLGLSAEQSSVIAQRVVVGLAVD